MSEISQHVKEHGRKLYELTKGFLDGEKGGGLYTKYQDAIETATPQEVVEAFDMIMKDKYAIEDVKTVVNKVLNLLYKSLNSYSSLQPAEGGFLDSLKKNNAVMAQKLEELKPWLKKINKKPSDNEIRQKLIDAFTDLLTFKKHYVIKENQLFPVIEKYIPEHGCLQIMWSFHDDIYRNLNELIKILKDPEADMFDVNQLFGIVFFNMLAIKFREEKILFPVILERIPAAELDSLLAESVELGYPYYTPELKSEKETAKAEAEGRVDLGTGQVTVDQLKLIFSHLPVDITYVDENDRVVFFSTPPHRIFPRTKAVIGRTVQNCHPHESVDVVNRIVASFKSREKDVADFWFNMGEKMIYIRYYAVRTEEGEYKGVLEVSQEVSDIRKLEGVKKLLDW
jgi:DUF438 domain-containing protein